MNLQNLLHSLKLKISSPANVHPTKEHPIFSVHIDTTVMVKAVKWCWLMNMRSRSIELRLDGGVILLVDYIIHRVSVYLSENETSFLKPNRERFFVLPVSPPWNAQDIRQRCPRCTKACHFESTSWENPKVPVEWSIRIRLMLCCFCFDIIMLL